MVGVGAVPPVDGLVGVAHHAEVGSTVQPGVEKLELERVHVLELVHVQVAEPPPLGVGKPLVGGQGPTALVEQVVEVDHPLLFFDLLVLPKDPGHSGRRQGEVPLSGLGGIRVGLRSDAPGLGPLDLSHHV